MVHELGKTDRKAMQQTCETLGVHQNTNMLDRGKTKLPKENIDLSKHSVNMYT